jgi:outer membrane biosynthesis protein TonB
VLGGIPRKKIKMLIVSLACCVTVFAQARQQAIRISAGVLHGLVQHAELPKYPEEALQSRTHGDVIFKVVVDNSGKIILSTPIEGDPLLVAASVDALRDFRFQPYLLNGEPVPRVESQVGFHFSIRGDREGTSGKVEYLSSVPFRLEFRTGVVTDKGLLVLWPRKISGEEPQLPPDLAGKAGSVYLSITIGTDGKVQDVKVIGVTNARGAKEYSRNG